MRDLEKGDQSTRSVIHDRLHLCAYRDCSRGLSTIGPFEGIEGLTSLHLASYVNSNYTGLTGKTQNTKQMRVQIILHSGWGSASPRPKEKNVTLSCFKNDVKQGVDILVDLVTNVPVGNLAA